MAGITSNAAGFVAAAAPAAGVPMTLVTTNAPAPLAGQLHNNAVPILLTSGGAGTVGGTFTVVGTDRRGNPQTEIIPAPAAISSTSSGHLLFNTVSSITPSATNTATISVGWGGTNYGPWLITAFHQASVVSKQLVGNTAGDFDVATTTYDLLDPTVFLPQGQGGGVTSDANDGAGSQNTGQGNGPYPSNLPWPLVPAALQSACPQLLSTVNCLPEDDGTYSEMIIAPTTFTAAAVPAAGGATGSQARLDPTGAFAWRLVINHATPVVELDVNIIRPSLS